MISFFKGESKMLRGTQIISGQRALEHSCNWEVETFLKKTGCCYFECVGLKM